MESPHQIFLIPEVLESVLLHLDLSTILLSQRVCHLWNALIQTSPSLQTALFFRPELEPPTQNEKPERAINPFLNQLLNHFVSNHEPGHDTAVSSYLFLFGTPNKSDPSLLELKQKHAYLRPEASWRGMLLHQPPVLSLAVSDDLIPLTVEDIERKAAAFLRLKHLERLVEVCYLLPVGNLLIFYPMQHRPPWRRAPVTFLRRILNTSDTYIVPKSILLTRLLSTAGDVSVECGSAAGLRWLNGFIRRLRGWGVIKKDWESRYLPI